MDRRKAKTKKAIIEAFSRLIQTKSYADISIQDVIDEADVARATFYDHYKNKEDVLISISGDIFAHITAHTLDAEKHHDFSRSLTFSNRIVHLLYHLKEDKEVLSGILESEGHDVFLNDLKAHLDTLFSANLDADKLEGVPREIYINFAISTLSDLIIWWIKTDKCKTYPEDIASYYFKLIQA